MHCTDILQQEESLRLLKIWVMTWNLCRIGSSESILRGRCGTVNYHILSPGFKFNELKAFLGENLPGIMLTFSGKRVCSTKTPQASLLSGQCIQWQYDDELLSGSNSTGGNDLPRWWGPFLGGSESAKECNFGGGLDLHGSLLRCHVH